MIYVLLADGFEEVEAIAPADVMRRHGIDVALAGVGGTTVCGAHSVRISADIAAEDIDLSTVDGILLPGGMPGTLNLQKSDAVNRLIKHCGENHLMIAAICAAPMILGELGLLRDMTAVCFPGFEEHLHGADLSDASVVVCDNIITAKGAGAALELGAAMTDYIAGADGIGDEILAQMQYPL